jgi:hypothetical protein
MNRHLNLMPLRVQYRQALWGLARRWLLVAAVAVLVAFGLAWRTWAGYLATLQRQAELRSAVQAARQTLDEVKSMQRQLKATTRQQAVALALADERPVLTLLGVVSQAARASDVEVAMEKLSFTAAAAEGKAKSPALAVANRLELRGVGRDNVAIAQFVAAMRDAGVFAAVDLKATAPSQLGSAQVRTFHVECTY